MTFKQLIFAAITLALVASAYALPTLGEVKVYLYQWILDISQSGLMSVF
jgi:hypothetical protein